MNYCKLVTQDLKTHNQFQWELGKKETIKTTGGELCSSDFFHYYSDPLLSVFLNPIHADIENPRLFLVDVVGETLSDRGLKLGSKELTLIKEIDLPEVTLNQRIAFGILCALGVSKEPEFVLWANGWLDGSDRSSVAARAAAKQAARAATRAARAADAADYAAAAAADAADYAAARAADAAQAAADAANLDLISLANKALTY